MFESRRTVLRAIGYGAVAASASAFAAAPRTGLATAMTELQSVDLHADSRHRQLAGV
jgi:hypothetical protein